MTVLAWVLGVFGAILILLAILIANPDLSEELKKYQTYSALAGAAMLFTGIFLGINASS